MVASVCVAAACAALAGSPALAQGRERPFSWTGFYIGFHGAYAWADMEFPGAPPHPAGPPRNNLEGGFLGGQVGYNMQVSGVVLGVEADLSKGNLNQTARDGNAITQTDTIDWIGTVRGRIGLPLGPVMPYATAGLMWDRATRQQQCPDPAAIPFGHCNTANGFAPYNLSEDKTHTGFVWGGGVEYQVSRFVSFKVEGLFSAMSKETYTLGPTPSGKMLPASVIEHDIATVKVGANVRF
ncbi:MAG TPA: outer membrane beta-barrel protein [Hyphomicrobiaceae bacterium]|jgi:outer membrane immunogenic protein|nr:outer membrane beta-barrel protein [Hyphomicrobiaceae bacterium]